MNYDRRNSGFPPEEPEPVYIKGHPEYAFKMAFQKKKAVFIGMLGYSGVLSPFGKWEAEIGGMEIVKILN